MNNQYTDKQLGKKYGFRLKKGEAVIPIDNPAELGYRCKKGHSNLAWSEFLEHLWCYECKMDYHYTDCVLIKHEHNPKGLPKQPRMITGIKNWSKDGNNLNDIPAKLLKEKK